MVTARFFSGASLFALLIVDICCLPVKKGSSPSAPAAGVSAPAYQPAPQPEPSLSQPAVHVGSSSSSRPVVSRHHGSTVGYHAVAPPPPGAASQPGPHEVDWALAPPGVFSGEEQPAHAPVHSGTSGYVSPPYPPYPPQPMYEAGELSHYEENYEMGDYLRETEDQGYAAPVPPPPMPMSAEPSFTSPPRPGPGPGVGGGWGGYPYFDYRLLYGDYPPGTYTHFSSNFEQGADYWYDDHYIRYDPYDPAPVQEPQTFTAPQRSEEPKTPVKAPATGGLGSSPGSFRRPTLPRRYNPGKGGY
ncbi:uncharacterized protein LOC108885549 [Lates calcarifer]|uniref:Uncharacterized protein LOC108885549 n=1 Tax=Lates calcarifer TaxID=8187 RepID=A0AAJ7V461_LATCA|nr:uncharacterized protein LOC108885549 [Lates calcarifer]